MQPDTNTSNKSLVGRVAGKEITLFFASPVAYLFLACFAAVSLFVFFWGESFFARNIADVRPLFEWMPLLLIFLCSTLTMRLWSEERRSGTLEHVLTQPAPLWHFVAGKFLACLALLAIALAITLPLPVTVAIIGELDWGPVLAGYLATFLLGAAYLSIGLFVSAQANNQIVSLIVASALCGFFYLLGAPVLTDLFGGGVAEWLRALGTGSRFDAVARGVIDLRDLYYYLSLVAVFLALNTLVLERERWASGAGFGNSGSANRSRWRAVTGLLVANALGANLWLGQIHSLRLDVTEGRLYSISPATRGYLAQLEEPLLIRGYFSSKTHPLLAPLVPQLRDLLREYEVAGDGRVRVEFVDPARAPELEEEANQKYGIAPVPFQVADRYQASIVSSYFDVLVQYGDEHQVLGFRDLIEVKAGSETDVDVQLRNPEHDLTRAVRKVLQSYRAGGNLFDTVKGELAFTAYVSADQRLPQQLLDFKQSVREVAGKLQKEAGERLSVEFIEPEADGGAVAKQIAADYGFQPMAAGLFGEPFYFYLTLSKGDQVVQIPLDDLQKESLERNFEAGIKRFASGFTKTVALVTPEPDFAHGGGARFSQLESLLGAELNIEREDLGDGRVSGNADILLLLSPRNLDRKQLYAVDQFLMQGGTVIAATSPYSASLNNRNLSLASVDSGLDEWLEHMGLKIEDKLVLDPQNSAFPVPVTRNIGGFQLQELRMLDYPYFVDLRGDGLNGDNPITANLPQATLSWASPITVDTDKSVERQITELLKSSEGAWLSASTDVMPRLVDGAVSAFAPEGERGARLLGVISSGRFDSYFAGEQSPLLAEQLAEKERVTEEEGGKAKDKSVAELESLPAQISRSPESARIVLFSSNDFLRDQVLRMSGSAAGSEYLNTLQLLANSVDWALEDTGLLSIRSRSHFNRTLPPMEHGAQLFWEYLNYICALLALGLVALVQQLRKRARQRRYRELLAG